MPFFQTPPNSSVDMLELTINEPSNKSLNDCFLVGKFLTKKVINFRAIQLVLTTAWNLGSNISIKSLDKNIIVCTFNNKENRDKILELEPWAVKEATLNLKLWPPNISFNEIDFSKCTWWYKFTTYHQTG